MAARDLMLVPLHIVGNLLRTMLVHESDRTPRHGASG